MPLATRFIPPTRAAPGPDEAEALRAKVVETALALEQAEQDHLGDLHRYDAERSDAEAALECARSQLWHALHPDRASSPAPSPVEAAAECDAILSTLPVLGEPPHAILTRDELGRLRSLLAVARKHTQEHKPPERT